ncbi:hypothetical protein BFF78_16930 [Streptomyces fodineus]|uniref:Uncharacterized protein n=1 Tax=Streptomyces fodineus TaxID=1904616 RepID=A0A1D7YAD8_9ACTN|nr:hypothetical protein BFF78_16930 [Streptomyces fodineus]
MAGAGTGAMAVGAALGTTGMAWLPGPVRGTLGRRRERVVVLPPTTGSAALLPAAVSAGALSVTVPAALPRRPALPRLPLSGLLAAGSPGR